MKKTLRKADLTRQKIQGYSKMIENVEPGSKLERKLHRMVELLKYKYNRIIELIKCFGSNLSEQLRKDEITLLRNIRKAICEYFNVTENALNLKTRKRVISEPRQICHYFAKKYTRLSLFVIGNEIGRKNHATVIHSCNTVKLDIATSHQFKRKINEIDNLIFKIV